MLQFNNLAVTHNIENDAFAVMQNVQNSVDPREQIIASLEEQNQDLLQVIDKAADVFQKNREEKDLTIASQAKSIEDLSAALIAANSRNDELVLLYEAAMKALQDQQEDQKKIVQEENQKILILLDSLKIGQKILPCDLGCCKTLFHSVQTNPVFARNYNCTAYQTALEKHAETNIAETAIVELIKLRLQAINTEFERK